MKLIRRLKKRYFTFFGMLFSAAVVACARIKAKIASKTSCPIMKRLLSDDDDPPTISPSCFARITLATGQHVVFFMPPLGAKHCDCVFYRKTCLALFLSSVIFKKPCRCRRRKSGLAPPISLIYIIYHL